MIIRKIVSGRDFNLFHNGLRILRSIDEQELAGSGVNWPSFRDDPVEYFIRCGDDEAAAIWRVIEGRQPRKWRQPK
jgi:hypothetical protein